MGNKILIRNKDEKIIVQKVTDSQYYNFSKLGKIKLGVYFGYGFSYQGEHYTDRLLEEFSDRGHLWGWTESSVENMEEQIVYASAGGISFFAFDWYYNAGMVQLNSCVLNKNRCIFFATVLMLCVFRF